MSDNVKRWKVRSYDIYHPDNVIAGGNWDSMVFASDYDASEAARKELVEANENLQRTLKLHINPNKITLDPDYCTELEQARIECDSLARQVEAVRALPTIRMRLGDWVRPVVYKDDLDAALAPLESCSICGSALVDSHCACWDRPATVPLKTEAEIAEAISMEFRRTAMVPDILADSIGRLAARTVISRGIAYSPEQVERMAEAIHDTWDHGVLRSIDGCRGVVANILAAAGQP